MSTLIMNTVEAKEQFTDLVNRVTHSKERVILTRRGKEIAAIVPLEDLMTLQELQDQHDLREAIESLKEARLTDSISIEKLKEEI